MNKEELIQELQKININLSDEQFTQIDAFCDYLLEYNQHTNLTAIRDKESIFLKHIYDSLTIIKVVDFNTINTVLDIGTGPGFPGIVLKFIYPNIQITLLDSNNKKTKFLETVKNNFQLENITIVNSRAEEYINNHRESFDLVTSRAVARLNILVELAIPYIKIDGLFIAMKGIKEETESEEGIESAKLLSAKIKEVYQTILPIEKSERTIYVFQKEKATNNKYPRRYEQIKKNPLKIITK